MIKIRKSDERGHADHGWLNTYHTFSFADYYDPAFMGYKTLRVINEDRVDSGKGFGTHGHRDMEILSYAVSGELAHKDSMGNVKSIKSGEVQAMSAGSGVTHSEFNPSQKEKAHFLQIWILPERKGLTPSYSEWKPGSFKENPLQLIASPDGRDESIKINQQAEMLVGRHAGEITLDLSPYTAAWLQLIDGNLQIEGQDLQSGDGAQIEQKTAVIKPSGEAHYLLFKLK